MIEWRVWNTGWKAASHTSTSAGYTYTRMLAQPRVRVRCTRKLLLSVTMLYSVKASMRSTPRGTASPGPGVDPRRATDQTQSLKRTN